VCSGDGGQPGFWADRLPQTSAARNTNRLTGSIAFKPDGRGSARPLAGTSASITPATTSYAAIYPQACLQRMKNGGFHNVEDALFQALKMSPPVEEPLQEKRTGADLMDSAEHRRDVMLRWRGFSIQTSSRKFGG
jgi:hypothetical protein